MSETSSTAWLLESACVSFLSTCFPCSSNTLMLLEAGSTDSLNQIRTSVGALSSLLPTRGCARTINACASARTIVAKKQTNPTANDANSFCIFFTSSQRTADRGFAEINRLDKNAPARLHRWNFQFDH